MSDYTLRPPQEEAVLQTLRSWQDHHRLGNPEAKFLWNAKPRFGKTLAAYDFASRITARRILIITNRPALASSWSSDFFQFIASKSDYLFAAPHPSDLRLADRTEHIYSRSELTASPHLLARPLIYFISLQDIKGKSFDSRDFKAKNQWIFDRRQVWDLVIIDEGHEGVKTARTAEVLKRLHSEFVLYLSGTPFRALADGDFMANQIYNYSYLDEQKYLTQNPAEIMPQLNVHTYTLPGPELSAIFSTDWLDRLAVEFRETFQNSFRHTFWLLPSVADCEKMQKLLQSHPFFREFRIILAVGKSESANSSSRALTHVVSAIGADPAKTRTITLSCGQLTTGITIPVWNAVLMLYNSAELDRTSRTQYLQASFRAQNPNPGKDKCYLLDFLPERALTILEDYAVNLCGLQPKRALGELMPFMPIYHHGDFFTAGMGAQVQPLSPASAFALPRQLIATEIVENKFIFSNKLFNISNIFHASPTALEIIQRLSKKSLTPPDEQSITLQQSYQELMSHSDFANLAPTERQRIRTLARIARDKKRKTENDYRDKLRQFSRTIPLLLHLYGDNEVKFPDFFTKIPDQEFFTITGITKSEFTVLQQENYFNADHCTLAMREFMRREHTLANFQHDSQKRHIFDYITSVKNYIFTPREMVDLMLNKLEQQNCRVFDDPGYKFLDPACRSGIFISCLVQRLFQHQRPNFSSDQKCLEHIFRDQVFAWCADDLSHKITLRTLFYFQGFDFQHHIIKFNPRLKELSAMNFDIIIGNPPYQSGRRQIYADFYKLAVDLDPELLCMVFPMGWQKTYNHNGLGQLNNATYKRDPHLVSIDNYYETGDRKMFPDIGTGGVNIVLRDRNSYGDGHVQKLEYGQPSGTILLPIEDSEIEKPAELTCLIPLVELLPKMSTLGSARKPYGFYADPLKNPQKYHLKLQTKRQDPGDVRLFGLMTDGNRGYRFIPRDELPKTSTNLDAYKIFVPKAWGNMAQNIGLGGSFANICVAAPGDACTETFIEFGPFATEETAIKMAKYFMTKCFRAFLFLAKTSQNTAKDKYKFVPVPDLDQAIFEQTVDRLDESLFELYQIPETSREFIRQNFQTRSEANIEIL